MLGNSNQQKSMLGEASSHAFGDTPRPRGDTSPSPIHARMSSSYSQYLPGSPQRFPPDRIGSSLQTPVDAGMSLHARTDTRIGSYAQSRSRDCEYPQHAVTGSPTHRAHPNSPYHRAVPGSSPFRSPAHAAAVSAVEQQLHASLHEESGLLSTAQGRPAPSSPSPLPGYHHSQEHSQDRLDSAGAYQPWRGHVTSLNARQHPGQQLHDVPRDTLTSPRQLSQVPRDSHLLLRPVSQHLGHASPELDSLSQRLRDQKLAMDGQRRFGISPLQGRGASHSSNKEHYGHGRVPLSAGLGSTYIHTAPPDPSTSR